MQAKKRATQDKTPSQLNNEMSLIEDLLNYVHVAPSIGIIRWESHRHPCKQHLIGNECGYRNHLGYRSIKYKGRLLRTHRIVFYYVNRWLPNELDHRNRIKDDNRISNLRPTTTMLNTRNRNVTKGSKSGKTGVTYERGRWRARIMVNHKDKSLGSYSSCEEAVKARLDAEELYW